MHLFCSVLFSFWKILNLIFIFWLKIDFNLFSQCTYLCIVFIYLFVKVFVCCITNKNNSFFCSSFFNLNWKRKIKSKQLKWFECVCSICCNQLDGSFFPSFFLKTVLWTFSLNWHSSIDRMRKLKTSTIPFGQFQWAA